MQNWIQFTSLHEVETSYGRMLILWRICIYVYMAGMLEHILLMAFHHKSMRINGSKHSTFPVKQIFASCCGCGSKFTGKDAIVRSSWDWAELIDVGVKRRVANYKLQKV